MNDTMNERVFERKTNTNQRLITNLSYLILCFLISFILMLLIEMDSFVASHSFLRLGYIYSFYDLLLIVMTTTHQSMRW